MKAASLSVLVTTGILVTGCSSSIRSVESERQQLATAIGKPTDTLEFVANGDFAPVGELTEGFSMETKGVVAITADTLIWRSGQGNVPSSQEVRKIPLTDITGFSWDGGLVQMKHDGDIFLLRVTDWNRFQESAQRTDEFFEILYDKKLPIYVAEESYAALTHVGTHSFSSVLHDFRTAEDVIMDDMQDRANHAAWINFGNEGVPPREPEPQPKD